MAKARKPLDAGFTRNLKILGGVIGSAVLLVGGLIAMTGGNPKPKVAPSNIGRVVPTSGERNETLTPAQQAQLARVQANEADAARRSGRSYLPDVMLGSPEQIAQARQEPDPPPPTSFREGSYAPYARDLESRTGNPRAGRNLETGQAVAPPPAILQQAELIMGTLSSPAVVQAIAVADIASPAVRNAGDNAGSLPGNNAPGNAASRGPALIGGDEIIAARLLTPIDTDRTRFVLAEIAGGALNGAQLRGQVVPMSMSGSVEDVGIRFTSMRWQDQFYQIDAIALNEATATDAMTGDVDRHLFSRYAMPILMAGLSGVSSYFTARGTPAHSVATNVATGDSLVVQQDRANRKDAINQGLGNTTDKVVQTGDRIVNQMASRPNTVTLPVSTPIGVIFNAPVYVQAR